ncbi:RGCVC family protein [Amycolatopsis acidiphila]|uniref:RGCVC family protein n=1 Tax=Amycolatopsis acidiphila TaxID=715473 RepID=UPI001643F4E7|nr:RGCVC family protein [Amycolatopsis acidiphila]UIJ61551.1 RGCVC family protein [Amycolatopsis acidiphila]
MTDPAPTTSLSVQVDTCPVCPHPQENHDGLSRRYCAATAAAALDRGCICANRTPAG